MSEQPTNSFVQSVTDKGTFSVRDALTGQTYPTEQVTVYYAAAKALELNDLSEKLGFLHQDTAIAEGNLETAIAADTGIVEGEHIQGFRDALDKAKEAERSCSEAIDQIMEQVQASALTFTLKGLPPKQTLLIDKAARKAFPLVAREPFQKVHGENWWDFYETARAERDLDRDNFLHFSLIAAAILKVTNHNGDEDPSAWTPEAVDEVLYSVLLTSEYEKLRTTARNLSLDANTFQRVLEEDADFLSKH